MLQKKNGKGLWFTVVHYPGAECREGVEAGRGVRGGVRGLEVG